MAKKGLEDQWPREAGAPVALNPFRRGIIRR